MSLSAYSNLAIPVAIALIAIIVLVRIAIAIEHAFIRIASGLLTIIVLVGVLIVGFNVVSRMNTVQSATSTVAQDIAASYGGGKSISAAALSTKLNQSAGQTLRNVGLDPTYLRLRVGCEGSQAVLHLSYVDKSFMGGAFSNQDFTANLPPNVHC
jgi:hypothetical protein